MKQLEKSIGAIVIFAMSIILGKFILGQDFLSFFSWWITLFLLGIIVLPLTNTLFKGFADKGYLFSKIIGLAITGYFLWILSSWHILKFTSLSSYIVIGISIIVIVVILLLVSKWNKNENKKLLQYYQIDKDSIGIVITEEVMFFFVFLIWTYIRGFKPEAYGTEKFMDYGFMTTMMRSEYMPPQDLWFAGESINYYYVGQYFATYLTKVARVRVNEGYNLMLMTLASLGFMLPFSIVYNLIKSFGYNVKKKIEKFAVIGGLIAGAAVSLAGNMHFVLYYYIVPTVRTILGIEGEYSSYWFPSSTRYIGYNPDTNDKTIHEYPSYSYILGDLHAHVLNTIFVFTILAVLISYMIRIKNKEKCDSKSFLILVKEEILQVDILIISFLIGVFQMTNYWDFPIYYVVSGAIILFTNIKYRYGSKMITLVTTVQGISIFLISLIVASPFNYHFDKISSDIYLTSNHTPFFQLFILWGLPIILVISYFVHLCKDTIASGERLESNYNGMKKEKNNIIVAFIRSIRIEELFVITIAFCAIGLVLLPELIYIKDIYSGDYKRANTMFKLTYQAFILFGICFGYILVKFICFSKYSFNKVIGITSFVCLCLTIWYSKVGIESWYGNIFKISQYKGLDSANFMKISMNDDYLATNWLNENVEGLPVVLEANGDSYSDYQRVSVITGLPTVVGWHVHEWLWRSSEALVVGREEDVAKIYTSNDIEEVKEVIEKYNIEYIYVGKLEKEKFENLNRELLRSLGDVVFESYVAHETFIIKVK